MAFDRELSEKLTTLLTASVICGGTAALAPHLVPLGLVETLLGATAVGHHVLSRRAARPAVLLRRCADAVERGGTELLEKESRTDPDAADRCAAAMATIRAVLPRIVPTAEALVAARLDRDRVAAFYLDRAADARPDVFGPAEGNALARRLFRAVVAEAYRQIAAQPEFAAEVLQQTLAALLNGIEGVRQDIVGIPEATVAALLEKLDARGITSQAAAGGLDRPAIIALAQRLRPGEALEFDQAMVELEHAVAIALDVIARGERGSNLDSFVDAVFREVAEKTRRGELDAAAGAFDRGLAELDTAHRRARVALLEGAVQAEILRRDAFAVARRIEALVAAEDPTGPAAWAAAYRARYDDYFREGEEQGVNLSLSIAIELARRMQATATDANRRGAAWSLLGKALYRLGEREAGSARLEEAVTAYREALKEYTRQRVPLDWAATQNNLGAALHSLGEREAGPARLEGAVAAYREALKEYTRARVPLDWAATQTNLGAALTSLGERETGPARLEEAVAACREALKEYTRERVPLAWARTQNNLGNALSSLGERETGPARLEEAVAAYRDALTERTRERVPLDWAMTQTNLGNALSSLGERETEPERLEEAVAAYREALKERTRERVPLDWATTQNNLGNALCRLGEREAGPARLEEAVAAYREALKERTRERVPLAWATTQNNLGNALSSLGEREMGLARLEEAVTAYREALKECTRARVPLDWAMTQNNLGNALCRLGERETGPARLEEAVTAYREALKERTRERVPLDWAITQNNLGAALRSLGERETGPARLEEAVAAYREALKERTRERVPLAWAMTQNNLGNALCRLGEREAGPVRLEQAIAAYDVALAVVVAAGADHFIAVFRANRDEALTLLAARPG